MLYTHTDTGSSVEVRANKGEDRENSTRRYKQVIEISARVNFGVQIVEKFEDALSTDGVDLFGKIIFDFRFQNVERVTRL